MYIKKYYFLCLYANGYTNTENVIIPFKSLSIDDGGTVHQTGRSISVPKTPIFKMVAGLTEQLARSRFGAETNSYDSRWPRGATQRRDV